MDGTLTTILATIIASVLIIGAMAYWQGRVDERRARTRYAHGSLARKAQNEGRARL
jgi:hypothetical protein